jgi:hypothetical protein
VNPNDLTIGGVYALTADVIHKHYDKRQRYDWRKQQLTKAGARFIVRDDPGRRGELKLQEAELSPEALERLSKPVPVLERTDVKHPTLYRVGPHDHPWLYEAIVPLLMWCQPTLDDEMKEAHEGLGYPVDARDIIDYWLETGKVGRGDVTDAIRAIKEREA